MLDQICKKCYVLRTLMTFAYHHPNYYKKLKQEAASNERLHASNTNRFGNYKQASKEKKQASNQQASKVSSTVDHGPGTPDPQAQPSLTSPWIRDPGKSFMVQGPRALTKIKVSLGWVIWNAIWCGEKFILLAFVTFNSTVKKCRLVLYPKQSGRPIPAVFSILFQVIPGVFFLSSCHSFLSGVICILSQLAHDYITQFFHNITRGSHFRGYSKNKPMGLTGS